MEVSILDQFKSPLLIEPLAGHMQKKNNNSIKKKRARKVDKADKLYCCDECNKAYMSYPALYTHKRNKHNIIPITDKPNIFKTKGHNGEINKV